MDESQSKKTPGSSNFLEESGDKGGASIEPSSVREFLEYLSKKTEEMEKRLARILEDCESLEIIDGPNDSS